MEVFHYHFLEMVQFSISMYSIKYIYCIYIYICVDILAHWLVDISAMVASVDLPLLFLK